jgi:hypothetical protein
MSEGGREGRSPTGMVDPPSPKLVLEIAVFLSWRISAVSALQRSRSQRARRAAVPSSPVSLAVVSAMVLA